MPFVTEAEGGEINLDHVTQVIEYVQEQGFGLCGPEGYVIGWTDQDPSEVDPRFKRFRRQRFVGADDPNYIVFLWLPPIDGGK